MRNLYKALGQSRILEDERTLASLLGEAHVDPSLREAATLILLDPRRKPIYDAALRGALHLAEVRRQLGMKVDPGFPPAEWAGFASTEESRIGRRGMVWTWVLGGLAAVLAAAVFAVRKMSAAAPVASPVASFGTAEAARSAFKEGDPAGVPAIPRPALDPTRPVPGMDPQLPPTHGWARDLSNRTPAVNWTVETEGGRMYLVTLQDAQTRQELVLAFLHGGQPFSLRIPEGEYLLSYSSGFFWYGLQHRFGPASLLIRHEKPHLVRRNEFNESGWTVRLEAVAAQSGSGSEAGAKAP